MLEAVLDGDSRFEEFAQMLTDKGVRLFARDIVRAIVEAKRTNDLRPVQETIDSWFRTSLLMRDPGFLKALAREEEDEEPIAREERRKLLGLA